MTKRELNAEIALYFGFRRSEGDKFLVNELPQWTYPDNWYLSQGEVPNIKVPDFLKILEDYLKLMKKHEYGGPREYFSLFDK